MIKFVKKIFRRCLQSTNKKINPIIKNKNGFVDNCKHGVIFSRCNECNESNDNEYKLYHDL